MSNRIPSPVETLAGCSWSWHAPAAWLMVALMVAGNAAAAEPAVESAAASNATAFRVRIQILDADTDRPLDQHLVLTDGVRFYDFALNDPHDVTVIDPASGVVTLLSRENQVKATVATQAILATTAQVRAQATERDLESRLGITVQPTKKDNTYSLAFAGYRYEATAAVPSDPMLSPQFAEFTQWAARVNLVRELGPPPFARMTLGQQIAADSLLPETVTLSCTSETVHRKFLSRYNYEVGLSQADQKRIAEVGEMITLYREVPLKSFPR
ncbi:hypothetical protein FYK55_11950 [Roseiconus nitratireducens]|uniref:Uncharacterized protein n=1 Tax=Roseiconus nitratireducens TaxID=2605748 RepID=A0A5M6D941_9BACT|nr:hypothetical protein [Roseiconus nitratireducens]KAA5543873.1 hypothetical protein FYK55_11950 [Roseiconus nitratireducens]